MPPSADISGRAGQRSATLFARVFDAHPTGVWSAPGRVNLIGEHTDYNDGLVLPFAIDSRASVAVSLADDGVAQVVSAQENDIVHRQRLDRLSPDTAATQGWSAYIFGALWVLQELGHQLPGVRLALDSNVPAGAGLSSSAAIECATTLAVSELIGLTLSRPDIARIAQRDENDYVGMPCGLMDQMASAACTAGNVLFFDTGRVSLEQVPFDPSSAGLTLLVIDTRVKHALTDGEYAARRASCREAAEELGVATLRQLALADLPRLDTLSTDVLRRRVRHVITENARVADTVTLLHQSRYAEIGPLMLASHESLRDDYEVSDPALDHAVEVAMAHGALGARMTGGGFGGSAIALVPQATAPALADAVITAFAAADRIAPVIRPVTPSAGAERDF